MAVTKLLSKSTNFRYLVYIVASFLVNLGITIVLHEVLRLSEEVSFLIALVVVSVLNFFVLRHWVYRATEGQVDTQIFSYIGSVLGFRTVEWLAFLVVHTWLGCPYQIAIVGILLAATIVKNVVYKRLIFRRQHVGVADGPDSANGICPK